MNFIFSYIGNVIIPTDELIFFRGVGSTTNQYNVYIYISSNMNLRIEDVGHNVLTSGNSCLVER